MPRHKKGVGEHSKNKKYKKGPLLIVTAFLTFYPVCMAEAATSTSSFEKFPSSKPYETLQHLPLQQSQKVTQHQQSSQPRNYRGLNLQSLDTPSINDLNDLYTTLSKFESQLQTLKDRKSTNPSPALDKAITDVETRISDLKNKINTFKDTLTDVEKAKLTLSNTLTSLQNAQNRLKTAQKGLESAKNALTKTTDAKNAQDAVTTASKSDLDTAQANYQDSLDKKSIADASLTHQQETTAQSLATLTDRQGNLSSAQSTFNEAQSNLSAAQEDLNQAQQTLNEAQSNYDTNLIPDPNWTPATHEVAYTRLVPVTTTITTGGVTAKSYNRQGYNNAPPLPTSNEQPIATTTVDNISFQWGSGQVLNSGRSEDVIVEFTGVITVPTTGYYQFYAPGDDGVQLYINGTRYINDWYDKGGGGSVSQQIYLEAGKSNTFTLYFYENGGGANVWLYYYTPNTGYQIVPASWLGQKTTTETTYVEETYYVTEVIPGQVQPLINDPALLPALQEAQANVYNKTQELQAAQSTFNEADSNLLSANSQLSEAQSSYNTELQKSQEAQSTSNEASLKVESNKTILDNAQSVYNNNVILSSTATSNESDAKLAIVSSQTILDQQQAIVDQNLKTKQQDEQALAAATTLNQSSLKDATYSSSQIQPSLDEANTILETPQGSPDIPPVIEDLMDVDLTQVDPTELTPEQADQLVEAALQTFETASEGSPEYQQALDALYLAAQQDDIVVSEDIANIPGVGQAAQAVVAVFNAIGNVGADISPKVRKKAQTLVVTTLVVGQIAQNAAMATAAAAGMRRKN